MCDGLEVPSRMTAEEPILLGLAEARRGEAPRGHQGTESPSARALRRKPDRFTPSSTRRTAVRGPYADFLAKLNSLRRRIRLLRLSHRREETKKAFHSRNLKRIVDPLIDAH
jgi:hypothetical protein